VLAIAASLVVAMTVTPALCLILLNNARLEGRESPVVVWLLRHYAPLMERATRTPRPAFITLGVVNARGDRCLATARAVVCCPSFKERDFLMHWVTTPDTSLPRCCASRPARARNCAPFQRTQLRRSYRPGFCC